VPIGAVTRSPGGVASSCLGESGPKYGRHVLSRNRGFGWVNRTTSVVAVGASMPSIGPSSCISVPALLRGSSQRSHERLTASAVSGVPSWKRTSSRSANV